MGGRELTAEPERRAAVPILRQLWRDESPEDVFAWTGEDEYRLFGGFLGDDLSAVAGGLEQRHLHHERHAWLYDLVVDELHRGRDTAGRWSSSSRSGRRSRVVRLS